MKTPKASNSPLPHDGVALGRINARRNSRKAEGYWLGFLEGVLASGRVEQLEMQPLKLEAEKFLSLLGDPDAYELLDDLRIWREDLTTIQEVIETILDVRKKKYTIQDGIDEKNCFYGFCAGIACDNIITVREIERLLERLTSFVHLEPDERLRGLKAAAIASIADGSVSSDESIDICQWIARLVGDSATDTGLATYGNVAIIEGAISDPNEIVFDSRMFVLTGRFYLGPRKAIEAMIARRGGQSKDNVCRNTDYLIVASEASRDWKHSHEGTKIIQALALAEQGRGPRICTESALARALEL